MKNRIIALVLVVVMSLLALSSCGSYDFADKDTTELYTTFDYAAFKDALGKIEIKDGDFTTNEDTRLKITAAKIYNAVVDKMIAATEEEERNTTFEEALTAGDVLYFVYYAVGKDSKGNEYHFDSAHMDVSYITNSTYKAQHVVKLDNYYYSEADTLLGLIKDAVLANLDNLNPYATKTKAQLEADFVEKWEEDHNGRTYAEVEASFKEDYKKQYKLDNEGAEPTDEQVEEAFTAFKTEYANAKADAIKVKEGNTYYVSYTRTYDTFVYEYELDEDGKQKLDENGDPIVKVDEDGNPVKKVDNDGKPITTAVTEKAVYEAITLNASNPLHAVLLNADATASVGDTAFKAFISKDATTGTVTTNSTFPVIDPTADTEKVKDGKYTYSAFAIKWMVEKAGTPIIVTHTPETTKDNTNDDGVVQKVEKAPDNIYVSGEKVDIVGMEWTYYVFPVYAIDAPLTSEITAYDVLYHVYGSKLTATSLEILGEEYKNGNDTVETLLKKIADMFDTKSTTNDYYKQDGGILYELNKAYNDAKTAGGSKPTDAQQDKIDETLKALNDKQDELLKEVIEKIVAATKDGKTLGDEVFKYNAEETDPTKVYTGEYYENNYHSLKESYDSDITKKVQTKVWELIDEMVKVDFTKVPADLVKEYIDHLYESYEYDFYKGNYTSSSSSSSSSSAITNYDKFGGSFDAYLIDKLALTTKTHLVKDELNAALKAEAEKYLEPIIKIFAVAKACETDALAVYKTYVEQDIAGGAYNVDREYYDELYPEDAKKAQKKYEEAVENAKENKESSLKEAEMFLINDAFMKNYKKEVGRVNYNSAIESYGEINLRAGFQFNKLFYYLTSTDIKLNEDGDHTETVYTEDGKLAFRTITYTLEADDAETEPDAQ